MSRSLPWETNFRYWTRKIGASSWEHPREHGIGSDGALERLLEKSVLLPFFAEKELEDLIAESPWLLTDSEKTEAAVAVQMHVPGAGRADVIVVDKAGEITIVECKLVGNKEISYSVVGQGLAYGAAFWQMPYEQFEQHFNNPRRKTASTGLYPPFQSNDLSEEDFRAAVERNLADGRVRLVLAVDEITNKPNRTVAYLARQVLSNRIRLVGFELFRVPDPSLEILRVEESTEDRAQTERRPHDIPRIINGIGARSPKAADVAGELLDWAEATGLTPRPTAAEVVVPGPVRGTLFRIAGKGARLKVSLSRVRASAKTKSDQRTQEFEDRLKKLGFAIGKKHAVAPLELLADDTSARTEFEQLMAIALDIQA